MPMDSRPHISQAGAYRKAGYSIAAYLCPGDVRTPPWRLMATLAGSEAARRARLGTRRWPERSAHRRAPRRLRVAAQAIVVDNWAAIDALAREMLSRPEEYIPAIVAEFLINRFRASFAT